MLVFMTLSAIMFVYLGSAFGFLMMTHDIPILKPVRRIYFYVPYITIRTIWYIIREMIDDKKYREIIPFVFLENKMLVVGLSMVKVATEYVEKHPKTNMAKVMYSFKYMSYKYEKRDNGKNSARKETYATHAKYTRWLMAA